jgi:hypothetical protein
MNGSDKFFPLIVWLVAIWFCLAVWSFIVQWTWP